jgi:hypothetical protein
MGWILWPCKYLHINVCRSFIQDHPKLEVMKMSLNEWMNTQSVVHPQRELLFTDTNNWVIKLWRIQRNHKCILLSKRSHFERTLCCMISILWQPGKGKTMEIVKKISSCQSLREVNVGWDEEVYIGFLGQQSYYVWYCNDIHLLKLTKLYKT